MGQAYRIVTERCTVRCWEPADAPALKRAVDESLAHLRPWLAWARDEPQPIEEKLELLRHFRARFDLGRDLVYGVFDHAEKEVFGGVGLHQRTRRDSSEVRDLGYWIAARWSGAGLASEVSAAVVRVAFEVEGVQRVEIHCDELNLASAGVAKKIGFRHDATLRKRCLRPGGELGGEMVWSMLVEEFGGSVCARAECEAFDGIGRRVAGGGEPRRMGFR
jgi:RimJ/RimL family protein N-acetyltransferase